MDSCPELPPLSDPEPESESEPESGGKGSSLGVCSFCESDCELPLLLPL